MNSLNSIAYFITPHGFGHATRACAVMQALQRRWPDLHCEIFTRVPDWLFAESLHRNFTCHDLLSDIGLVQPDALRVDLPATVAQLAQMLPFSPPAIDALARQITDLGCQMVFCDIAPMGVAVARAAGLPSVVVENFTWDWIYQGYAHLEPALHPYIDYLAEQFAAATVHIQTSPAGELAPTGWPVDLSVEPVARSPRTPPSAVRQALDLPMDGPVVLVTMGGMNWAHNHMERLEQLSSIHFLLAGGDVSARLAKNVSMLSRRSGFYHPDLVAASDAVVGKIGYSTLAEVYYAGLPYGFVPRHHFRESEVLSRFVEDQMSGVPIPEEHFVDGSWVDAIPELLAQPRISNRNHNGAEQIATFISRQSALLNLTID
jgi:hypothetical protein